MNLEVYFLVEQVADKLLYVSGPHPHLPAVSLAQREAKYADALGTREFKIVTHEINVKEL